MRDPRLDQLAKVLVHYSTGVQPGQLVRDNHGLLVPLTTEPGQYTLLLGLYPLDDPAARLPVQSSQATSGSYPLGSITVQ